MNRFLPILIALVAMPLYAAEGVPDFVDYRVSEVSNSRLMVLSLNAGPKAEPFRASAQEVIGKKANFAGHYILVMQGCGANCTAIALVDVQTGKIYPANFSAALGISYRVDSRMIIESPPKNIKDFYGKTPENDIPRLFYSTYYEWNERTKTFVEIYNDFPKPAPQTKLR